MAGTIEIQAQGRRYYLVGDTYPIRQELSAAGCHFDRETPPASAPKGAWWTSKIDVAKRFATSEETKGEPAPSSARDEQRDEKVADDTPVLGRARHKGREYLLLWEGATKRGQAAKLAFTDGSKVFWADAAAVTVTKRYQAREHRGQRIPMTFGRLQRLREEYAEQQQAAKEQKLVGEKAELVASVAVGKGGRPGDLGETTWIRHRSVRLAVVLVGYETPTFIRSDDAEDFGHYGMESGWYSTAYYRPATLGEYEQLQARAPRADGTCAAVGEAVGMALAALARQAST